MPIKKNAGARPGGRDGYLHIRCSPEEKDHINTYCKAHGNKTMAYVIREALVNTGVLPPDTKLLDSRTEDKLMRRLDGALN